MAECEHDWRVDPFVMLTSSPPMSMLVCATCGKKRLGLLDTHEGRSHDPRDWEKWHGHD